MSELNMQQQVMHPVVLVYPRATRGVEHSENGDVAFVTSG